MLYLKVTVDDVLLHFACGTFLLSVQQSAIISGLNFPWYRFSVLQNVSVKSLSVLSAHCPEIFWEEV